MPGRRLQASVWFSLRSPQSARVSGPNFPVNLQKNEEKQGKYLSFSQFSEDLRPENRQWHGGDGGDIAVSAWALEGRFVGKKCVVGRSSVSF